MHILFLTSQFPYPAHSGGALRADGLIRGAVAAGYQVELFCFADSLPVSTPLHSHLAAIHYLPPPRRSLSTRLRDLFLTRRADMSRRFWSEAAVESIMTRLAKGDVDIVHAESIEMAAYFPAIHAQFPDLPLIYGSLNAEADLQRSVFRTELSNFPQPRSMIGAAYSWIQWQRLTRLESHICEISSHVLAVSEPDRALLAAMSNTPVTVVKNGIDTGAYEHLAPDASLGEGAIVFTGTMDYRPNVDATIWFASEVLPRIISEITTAHFYAVGNRPNARVQALDQQPSITVTGRVPSMEPYWKGSNVYIAPLRMGSGTRFKILEAMAAGCAVVSTTIGAQGLGVTSGQELLLADTPQDFADAVIRVLQDASLRHQLSQTGRNFVREHFDWSVIVPHLLDVYQRVS